MSDEQTQPSAERPRLILITGLSGSGKSTAAKALEDLGYHCVDNLPLPLLRTFLRDPLAQVGPELKRIAVVADVRAPGFADSLPDLLPRIDHQEYEFILLFLEASEAALLRRFSETRRAHPLASGERPVIEGIRREQDLLSSVRGAADRILDTSDWTVHDVRAEIYHEFATDPQEDRMVVSLVSFGFKHGVPAGCDLLFDARFLANPYFQPHLREQTGKDEGVQQFLDEQDDFKTFVDKLESLLLFLLPRYRLENRSYVTIAVGCTGGRHRSVATCERLNERLTAESFRVRLNHRDLER